MGTVLYWLCSKSPFKECSAVIVHFVVGLGVAIEYELWQVACRFFSILPYHEMIMRGHKTICNHADIECLTIFCDL